MMFAVAGFRAIVLPGPQEASMSSEPEEARTGEAWGWGALVVVGLLVLAFTVAGALAILFYLFVPLCVVCGLVLLGRPAGFAIFNLGIWVWAPFVRRIIDYGTYYHQIHPALLAPPLLAAMAALAFRTWREGLAQAPAFVVLGLPMLWGLAVGLMNGALVPAAFAVLTWGGPVFLGLYVLGARRRAPGLEAQVLRALSILAFTASVYGILQFINPPIWDRLWMINSGLPVLGAPVPFSVRVFGPLNSPVPFAAVMVAGFIATVLDPQPWRWILAPTMLVALMLSLVRSEWAALALAIVAVALFAGAASLLRVARMFVVVAIVAVMGLPLLGHEPIRRAVEARLATFQSGSSDTSFRDRMILYTNFTFDEPVIGLGLGRTDTATRLSTARGNMDGKNGTMDSGVLQAVNTFGLPMAIVLMGVLAWLGLTSVAGARQSSWGLAGLAIVVAGLSQIPAYNMLVGAAAVLLYLGFAMSLPVAESRLETTEDEEDEDLQLGVLSPQDTTQPI